MRLRSLTSTTGKAGLPGFAFGPWSPERRMLATVLTTLGPYFSKLGQSELLNARARCA